MSGYLYKSKCDKKQGKRQWFVIKDKVLYTYAASEVRTDCHRPSLLLYVKLHYVYLTQDS